MSKATKTSKTISPKVRKFVSNADRRRSQADLNLKRAMQGFKKRQHTSIANHKCTYENEEEELAAHNKITAEHIESIRVNLPILLALIGKIKDVRNPKKIKYTIQVLLLYGMISFIFHMTSSRATTREMTGPTFWANLQALFPEFANNPEAPHHCTLTRLLSQIDVSEISNLIVALISKWIKKKKFKRYLIDKRYLIAIDGTQKMCLDRLWNEECLERTFNKGKENEYTQYFVYTLQATFTLSDGMTIPLMTEFLSYSEGDSDMDKQDCESKAFHRLAKSIKEAFPRLKITLLLDGLYPNGPIFEVCRKNNWEFLIVWQDKVLKSVERQFEALTEYVPENRRSMICNDRDQDCKWANGMDYEYGPNKNKSVTIHAVECFEKWEEIAVDSTEVIVKTSKHRWISSMPLNKSNLHSLCNLCARARWTVESMFLVEKHHGYQFEHCFSYDWNAMKGYHYLMQLAHVFNVMAKCSKTVVESIKELGMRGFIRFVRDCIVTPWLDRNWMKVRLGLVPSTPG